MYDNINMTPPTLNWSPVKLLKLNVTNIDTNTDQSSSSLSSSSQRLPV